MNLYIRCQRLRVRSTAVERVWLPHAVGVSSTQTVFPGGGASSGREWATVARSRHLAVLTFPVAHAIVQEIFMAYLFAQGPHYLKRVEALRSVQLRIQQGSTSSP